MSSPEPQPQPSETSPLLGTNSRPEDDVEQSTSQTQPMFDDKDRVSLWFSAALVTGLIAAGFLLAEWLMAVQGWEQFRYREWSMDEFRQEMFWALLVSIIFTMANLVRLRTTRAPLPLLLNVFFLLFLAFFLVVSVAKVVQNQTWSRDTYCERHDAPSYPGYPDDPNRKPPRSIEECLKWAPKMQVVILLFIVLCGFHALLIGRLLVSVLETVFDRTSRYFRENATGSRPNQIYVQVSLGWGSPQPRPVDAQPPQETAPVE